MTAASGGPAGFEGPFEIVSSVGVAITVLVCALVVTKELAWSWSWRPVAAVGSMSLTAHTGHVIAIGVLGLNVTQGPPLPVLLGFIVGAVLFALVWSRFFRRGLLEFLVHSGDEIRQPPRWKRLILGGRFF